MKEQLEKIRQEALGALESVKDAGELDALRVRFLGKKGELTGVLKMMGKLSAEELLHHAQMEWAVESIHWLLDVHYGEDYCRIANKAAQQNLNSLRKFALSLIKRYKAQTNSKRPLSQIMLDCLLELDLLCAVLES